MKRNRRNCKLMQSLHKLQCPYFTLSSTLWRILLTAYLIQSDQVEGLFYNVYEVLHGSQTIYFVCLHGVFTYIFTIQSRNQIADSFRIKTLYLLFEYEDCGKSSFNKILLVYSDELPIPPSPPFYAYSKNNPNFVYLVFLFCCLWLHNVLECMIFTVYLQWN